jgi:hypothetical protein
MTTTTEGVCAVCGCYVPAHGGAVEWVAEITHEQEKELRAGGTITPNKIEKRIVHRVCQDGTARVFSLTKAGGGHQIRNTNGRCENAPCCGCCD